VDFGSYRNQLLEQPEGEVAFFALVRNFSQWFFDLLRNFVLVGGLKYFYEKSGSEVLFYLHQFALFVIFLYCLSYADQWYVNLFGFLSNRRLAHFLNRIVNSCHRDRTVRGDLVGSVADRDRDIARADLISAARASPRRSLSASP
jgi:hypothetical protein